MRMPMKRGRRVFDRLLSRVSSAKGRSSRRRLRLEQLENRNLLASDGLVAELSLRFEAVDPVTRHPLTHLHPGDEFAVAAYARDLRAEPTGVFSMYFDLDYSQEVVELNGPITERGTFTNGPEGDVSVAGFIDELGGFSEKLSPPTSFGEQLVALIPFRATAIGVLEVSSSPADILPGHEALFYGENAILPTEKIRYGGLRLEITDVSTGMPEVSVLNDDFFIKQGAENVKLDVLANDSTLAKPLSITSVDSSHLVGRVTIAPGNRELIYTPPANFSGFEFFRYTATDARQQSSQGTVTVFVGDHDPSDVKSAVHLSLLDLLGRPISSLDEGDEFLLSVGVEDLRDDPTGVFAAYTDVAFSSATVKPTGPLRFNGTFANGIHGTIGSGLIDEAGAFQGRLSPVGSGVFTLFQVPMIATRPGLAIFQAAPADLMPDHQWLVFNENQPVHPAQIAFDQLRVVIQPRLSAIDDSFDVDSLAASVHLPVLDNDFTEAATPLRITSVDIGDATGKVTIAEDGKSLLYQRAAGFVGSEQFRYVVTDGAVSDVAEVTVHVQPEASSDDVLEIRLELTDSAGTPLSTIAAGEPFEVRAFVKDLRATLIGDTGVFAAYLDLLYEAANVSPVSNGDDTGVEIIFGPNFTNDPSGDGHRAGIIDEVGAFQAGFDPLGSEEQLLFIAKFQANAGRAIRDQFVATEDTPIELDVLANDSANQGRAVFKTDPADQIPGHEILLFDPPQPLELNAIRFGQASIEVTGGEVFVTEVGPSRHGGTVSIVDGGRSVRYTPPRDFTGTDDFTYSLGSGAKATVQVRVEGTSDAPVSVSDSYFVSFGSDLVIDAQRGVLSNDRDPDRDPLQAELVQAPQHGELVLAADGSFTYVPNETFAGHDSFTYRATDGDLSSDDTHVSIEVASPPVRIRLAATNAIGDPVEAIDAGEQIFLRAFVQDTRDDSRTDRGVGAAYVDIEYDASILRPIPTNSRLGFDVTFGPQYQNAHTGSAAVVGMINDVGGLQTLLTPIGRDEQELFTIPFNSIAFKAEHDQYDVSKNTLTNVLNVLDNEEGIEWEIDFTPRDSGNSPLADIALFEPPQSVRDNDVEFVGASVTVKNGKQLSIIAVSTTTGGGVVVIDNGGRAVRYSPPLNYVGTDSFTYTVRDEHGRTGTAIVNITVIDSWTNEVIPLDTNGDSIVVPTDALVLINDLNSNGIRELPETKQGSAFLDVNRDGFITPLDALAVINFLNRASQGEGESTQGLSAALHVKQLDAVFGAFLLDDSEDESNTPSQLLHESLARTDDLCSASASPFDELFEELFR